MQTTAGSRGLSGYIGDCYTILPTFLNSENCQRVGKRKGFKIESILQS